jgi:hypothetical protein
VGSTRMSRIGARRGLASEDYGRIEYFAHSSTTEHARHRVRRGQRAAAVLSGFYLGRRWGRMKSCNALRNSPKPRGQLRVSSSRSIAAATFR